MSLPLALALLLLSQADSPKPGALDFNDLPWHSPSREHLLQVIDAMKMERPSEERVERLRFVMDRRVHCRFDVEARLCADPKFRAAFIPRLERAIGRKADAADVLHAGPYWPECCADDVWLDDFYRRLLAAPALQIKGRIFDADGRPASEVDVISGIDRAFTDLRGEFVLGVRSEWGDQIDLRCEAGERGVAVLAPALLKQFGLRDVVLRASAVFAGVVRDRGGDPVPCARVRIAYRLAPKAAQWTSVEHTFSEWAFADGLGRFRLVVPKGSTIVRIAASGPELADSELVSPVARPEALEFVLKPDPHGTVRGVVKDPDGAPIPFCSVENGFADDQGRFRIRLPVGKRQVTARPRAWLPASQTVDVAADKIAGPIELRSEAGKFATGVVTGPDGKPRANLEIRALATSVENGHSRFTRTDTAGRFRLEPMLPAAEYQLSLSNSDSRRALILKAGETDRVIVATLR